MLTKAIGVVLGVFGALFATIYMLAHREDEARAASAKRADAVARAALAKAEVVPAAQARPAPPARAKAAPAAPAAAPIVVSARALERAYNDNEVAADELYKGKTLRVEGTIESINKDIAGGVVIIFRSPSITGAHCHLGDKAPPEITKLRRGRKARVVGVGAGTFMGPQLNDCRLEAYTE